MHHGNNDITSIILRFFFLYQQNAFRIFENFLYIHIFSNSLVLLYLWTSGSFHWIECTRIFSMSSFFFWSAFIVMLNDFELALTHLSHAFFFLYHWKLFDSSSFSLSFSKLFHWKLFGSQSLRWCATVLENTNQRCQTPLICRCECLLEIHTHEVA